MGEPTFFIDATAVAARAAEVPGASFDNGMNNAGSCGEGIGINMNEGAIIGSPEQFTLLDQFETTRTPQVSQHIGGTGLDDGSIGTLPNAPVRFGTMPTQAAKDADPALDGTVILSGFPNATLNTLGVGWEANV